MSERTGYTMVGDAQIGFRVAGDGYPPILYMSGSVSHIDVSLEEPTFAYFANRLAAMGTLIRFDRRGSGTSDPLPADADHSWETWVDDIVGVLDGTDTPRAVLIAAHDAGPMTMLFAATFPERVIAAVVFNSTARAIEAPDYPIGWPEPVGRAILEGIAATWGTEATTDTAIPSMAGNERFRRWYAKFQRAAATPRVAAARFADLVGLDIRHMLGTIQAPVLVMHRTDLGIIPVAHGRYLAERIPGARFIEVPGSDLTIYTEHIDLILNHIEAFLAEVGGDAGRATAERALASVLFVDIVDSTAQAAQAGDQRWGRLLDTYDATAARHVERLGGRVVKHIGDGTLATFDGPSRAIDCAVSMRDSLRDIGLQIRAGVHCGEIEVRGADIGGIGVHIASRVAGLATGGEVLVSRTVKDLVTGSGYRFDDLGAHELKGVPEPWQLFRAEPSEVVA